MRRRRKIITKQKNREQKKKNREQKKKNRETHNHDETVNCVEIPKIMSQGKFVKITQRRNER